VRVRSRSNSPTHGKALAAGSAGALVCVLALVGTTAIALVIGLGWPGGSDRDGPRPITSMPDAPTLHLLLPDEKRASKRVKHERPKHAGRREDRLHPVVSRMVRQPTLVIPDQAVKPAPSAKPAPSLTPAPAPATSVTPVVPTGPAAPAAPSVTASSDKGLPGAVSTVPVAPGGSDQSARFLRLRVREVGVAPSAVGDPELLVKLAIDGATPADGVPEKVTLHLRPQVPAAPPQDTAPPADDAAMALRAQVDVVEAEPSAQNAGTMRMRVRMAIAPADPAENRAPMVQDGGQGDGKSNVLAVTVPMTSFAAASEPGADPPADDPPADPAPPEQRVPGDPGPSDPGPPQEPAPGDPAPGEPAPSDPAPGEPTPGESAPGEPTPPQAPAPSGPAPPQEPAPGDPVPGDPAPPQAPAPGDPAPPQAPAPGDPTPPQQPAPATPPASEILIDLGPLGPTGETTTVPVTPAAGNGQPAAETVPVVVVVQEGLIGGAAQAPRRVPTPAAEPVAVEVPAPPADAEPDPTPTPDATTVEAPPQDVAADQAAPPAGGSS
jgi:hypothetical protein